MSTSTPFSDTKTTNAVAKLLALILNQEGWVKGVDELIVTGDLLQNLPESTDSTGGDAEEFNLVMTEKQFKAAKHCLTHLTEKGNMLPGQEVLVLAGILGFTAPTTTPTVEIKLPQIAAKYLSDVFMMPEKIKKVEDLISLCQVKALLPKLDPELTKKENDADLRSWMVQPCLLLLTERQRDVCRQLLKAAADDGDVRSNKYIPILYTEFGLRE